MKLLHFEFLSPALSTPPVGRFFPPSPAFGFSWPPAKKGAKRKKSRYNAAVIALKIDSLRRTQMTWSDFFLKGRRTVSLLFERKPGLSFIPARLKTRRSFCFLPLFAFWPEWCVFETCFDFLGVSTFWLPYL